MTDVELSKLIVNTRERVSAILDPSSSSALPASTNKWMFKQSHDYYARITDRLWLSTFAERTHADGQARLDAI